MRETAIQGDEYIKFIRYFAKRCDAFSFIVPDYSVIENEPCDDEDYIAVTDYLRRMAKLVFPIKDNVLLQGKDVKYFDQETNYFNSYYVIKTDCSSKIMSFLCAPNGIFNWLYPDYPEDLCFYLNGKRMVQTVAHEGMCFISPESKEDFALIRELKLDIWVDTKDDGFFVNY